MPFVSCAAPVLPDPGEGRCSKLWKKLRGLMCMRGCTSGTQVSVFSGV